MFKRIRSRSDEDAPAAKRRAPVPNVVDLLICLVAALALVMLAGLGGELALIAAISIIGLPIAILMWFAPFVAMITLPWRLAYIGLRFFLSKPAAIVLGLAITLGGIFIVDSRIARGTHPDIPRLLALDDTVPQLSPLPDGRLALTDMRSRDTQACRGLCAELLRKRLVREVVNTLPDQPARSLTLHHEGGTCPSGWDVMPDGYCLKGYPEIPPVSLTVERFRGREMIPQMTETLQATATTLVRDDTRPVKEMLRMTLRDTRDGTSATIRAFEVVEVTTGLFSLDMRGQLGEVLEYGPQTERMVFSSIASMSKRESLRIGLGAHDASFYNLPITLLNRALAWSDRAAPRN